MGKDMSNGPELSTGSHQPVGVGMKSVATMAEDLREKIISQPSVILDDRDVMKALIEANETSLGSNIVDLRGLAMERLETRLDRLEDTHRSVIAAAYENLAGTNQMHRAILRLLEPTDFEDFLTVINNSGEWQTRYPYTSWRSRSLNDYTGSQNSYADGNGYAKVDLPPEGYVVLAP